MRLSVVRRSLSPHPCGGLAEHRAGVGEALDGSFEGLCPILGESHVPGEELSVDPDAVGREHPAGLEALLAGCPEARGVGDLVRLVVLSVREDADNDLCLPPVRRRHGPPGLEDLLQDRVDGRVQQRAIPFKFWRLKRRFFVLVVLKYNHLTS